MYIMTYIRITNNILSSLKNLHECLVLEYCVRKFNSPCILYQYERRSRSCVVTSVFLVFLQVEIFASVRLFLFDNTLEISDICIDESPLSICLDFMA